MLGGKALCRVGIGSLSLVRSRLPDDVVHAVHQRPARANIVKRTTSFRPKHAAEVNVQLNKNLARLKSFSRRPSSRHAPTLRRLERDVVLQNLAPSKSLLTAERASPQQRRGRTAASWQSFLPARRIEVEPLILDVIPITTRMPWVLHFNSPGSPQHARLLLRQRHDTRACPDREDVVRPLRNKLDIGVLPRFPTQSGSFDTTPTGTAPSSKTTTCLFRTTSLPCLAGWNVKSLRDISKMHDVTSGFSPETCA